MIYDLCRKVKIGLERQYLFSRMIGRSINHKNNFNAIKSFTKTIQRRNKIYDILLIKVNRNYKEVFYFEDQYIMSFIIRSPNIKAVQTLSISDEVIQENKEQSTIWKHLSVRPNSGNAFTHSKIYPPD